MKSVLYFIGLVAFLSSLASTGSPLPCISEVSCQKDTLKKDSVHVMGIIKVYNKLFKNRSFILFPELARKPETGFLTGIYYFQLLHLSGKKDSTTRTSFMENYADYTQHHQIVLQSRNYFLFRNERIMLRGENAYYKFPSLYWGIGNHPVAQPSELISYEFYRLYQRLLVRMGSKLFAGMDYEYYKVSDVKYGINSLLITQNTQSRFGSVSSGAGFVVVYDTRDNIVNTFKGFYFDMACTFNNPAFGGQYFFTNVTTELKKFIWFGSRNVLAFQALLNYNQGNVPFQQMAVIGGDVLMRGYYTGRFRDKIMAAGQVEYRFKVWGPIGLTAFLSVAEISPTIPELNWVNVRYTVGGCFRFLINKKDRLNVGIDAGVGDRTSGLYFNSGEAF